MEQLVSILSQLPEDGLLLIRDDGSSDQTVAIIQSINDPRITLTCGENVGFAQSFFTLMATTPDTAEMIMLSDQDDVWSPQKIERAWQHIKNANEIPTLYCARQQLVDINLRPIALSQRFTRPPSFQNALTENIVTGCTAAFNRAALNVALKLNEPEKVYFHDWWLYLVVAAFGKVIMDDEPTILYRQHGGNVIGRGEGIRRYFEIVRFLQKTSWVHIMWRQIAAFKSTYSEQLSEPQQHLLSTYFDSSKLISILRLIFFFRRFRQSLIDEFFLRGLLIIASTIGAGLLPRPNNKRTH